MSHQNSESFHVEETYLAGGLGAGPVERRSRGTRLQVGAVSISHPFAYATPPSATNGAAYMKRTNDGSAEDVLLWASGALADRIQIHETSLIDGVAKKRPRLDGIAIPAYGRVEFAEGSFHLMLIGLKQPLKEGERVPLQLTFRNAGDR
ncbi:copper chaperone PCu(A)C [Aminobacter sp. AP02]|uniref:copper chaperone PCu(A)C n=1 Tax=Aminobacter sp. AP02 TaxID=2135737 RepID=UPI000D6B332F|nr:copper chaperone PCu(A)C [Aminobacter sp. AP02]PWK76681.1 copper(I)-binding protein [Aminobacter sp. AP02]